MLCDSDILIGDFLFTINNIIIEIIFGIKTQYPETSCKQLHLNGNRGVYTRAFLKKNE